MSRAVWEAFDRLNERKCRANLTNFLDVWIYFVSLISRRRHNNFVLTTVPTNPKRSRENHIISRDNNNNIIHTLQTPHTPPHPPPPYPDDWWRIIIRRRRVYTVLFGDIDVATTVRFGRANQFPSINRTFQRRRYIFIWPLSYLALGYVFDMLVFR